MIACDKILADDTDRFALLTFFYKAELLKHSMMIESPIEGRDCYDIKATVIKHPETVSKILSIHALSGCDTAAATYSIGKKTAVMAAQGHALNKIGKVESSIDEILTEATPYQCSMYGCQPCQSSTECRQKQWRLKVGKLGASALLSFVHYLLQPMHIFRIPFGPTFNCVNDTPLFRLTLQG